MEIIIAIIGMIWFFSRLAIDKADAAQVSEDSKARAAREAAWQRRVTNDDEERGLRLFISRPENRGEVERLTAPTHDAVLKGRRVDEICPRYLWPKEITTERGAELWLRASDKLNLKILLALRGYFEIFDAIELSGSPGITFGTEYERLIFAECCKRVKEAQGLKGRLIYAGERYGERRYQWGIPTRES